MSENTLVQTIVRVANSRDPELELDSGNLQWLTDDELSRYESITSANRKWQFLAGHYLVRGMAARFFANSHTDWIYFVAADNLRRLKCRQAAIPELYVSISHSGEWIAAAISGSPIGIDIETYAKQRDFMAIAAHVYSEAETSQLKSLASYELKQQFYLYWTLKECLAKQYGEGLKFEVSRAHSMIPANASMPISIISWQCPEYVLALAANPGSDIEQFGLCEDAKRLYWQNIPAISPLTD